MFEIVWTKRALGQLQEAYDYISRESARNAEKVVVSITAAISKAALNPEMYNPDKYKNNNDGSYRAFEKFHYRISYRFNNKTLLVLRVRHTRLSPESY